MESRGIGRGSSDFVQELSGPLLFMYIYASSFKFGTYDICGYKCSDEPVQTRSSLLADTKEGSR